MMGLTSKEHLYLRIVSIVVIINALVFYTMSRNLAFVSNLFEAAVLLTALTLVVLVVNVEFWWRYLRRTDNQRFWVSDFQALRGGHREDSSGNTELQVD